jgi:hypothetical protein
MQKGKSLVYDFGAEACVRSLSELITIDEDNLQAQKKTARSRKRSLEVTPGKIVRKRKPVNASTPRKLPFTENN